MITSTVPQGWASQMAVWKRRATLQPTPPHLEGAGWQPFHSGNYLLICSCSRLAGRAGTGALWGPGSGSCGAPQLSVFAGELLCGGPSAGVGCIQAPPNTRSPANQATAIATQHNGKCHDMVLRGKMTMDMVTHATGDLSICYTLQIQKE